MSGRYHHIRRIGVLGMWGIYISRGVVSAEDGTASTSLQMSFYQLLLGRPSAENSGEDKLYAVCVTMLLWWRSFGLVAVGMSE